MGLGVSTSRHNNGLGSIVRIRPRLCEDKLTFMFTFRPSLIYFPKQNSMFFCDGRTMTVPSVLSRCPLCTNAPPAQST